MTRPSHRRALPLVALLPAVVAVVAACASPLYSPCDSQSACADGLRCIDLGGDQQICTKPCLVTKERAGYPEGFANDDLFADGSNAQEVVATPVCSDEQVTVTSQDNPDQGAQNILVESGGGVGVCRVPQALLDDDQISGDSVLVGWCSPQ